MTSKTEFVLSAKDETKAAFDTVNQSLSKMIGASVNLGESFKTIAMGAAGLAGASSIAAFAGQINTAITAMGDLQDAAERTGASVENLSAIKGVAKLTGADFEQTTESIIRLSKALRGTDDESKGAGKALAALGLDVQKLRQMDPAEAFVELARAQEKFADGGGKSAAMMAILGKSGANAIPIMKDLAEQQKLVGKVTAEQAQAADEYDKNLRRLQAGWSSLSRQMAAAVVGPAKDVTDWMVEANKQGGILYATLVGIGMGTRALFQGEVNQLKLAEQRADEAFAKVGKLRQQLENAPSSRKGWFGESIAIDNTDLKAQLAEAESALRGAIKRRDRLVKESVDASAPKDKSLDAMSFGKAGSDSKGSAGSKAADPAASLIATLDKQIAVRALDLASTEKLTAAEKEAAEVMAQLDNGTVKATANQRALIEGKLQFLVAADREIEAQNRYNEALKKADEQMTAHRAKLLDSIAAAEKQADTYGMTESQISVVEQARLADAIAMARQNGASEEQLAYLEEELRLRAQLSDTLIKVDKKKIEQSQGAADQTNEFAQQAARNMQSAMADYLYDPFAASADKMAQKFGDTVRRMIADAAAAQLGKLLFGNMAGGAGGGSADSGLVGAAASFLGSVNWASLFAFEKGGVMTSAGPLPLKKYAMGGVANSPQLAMFGEGAQPEAYVPLPDGRNIPVKMAGQGGMTIHQTIYAGDNTDSAQVRRSAAAGARSVLGLMSGAQRYA